MIFGINGKTSVWIWSHPRMLQLVDGFVEPMDFFTWKSMSESRAKHHRAEHHSDGKTNKETTHPAEGGYGITTAMNVSWAIATGQSVHEINAYRISTLVLAQYRQTSWTLCKFHHWTLTSNLGLIILITLQNNVSFASLLQSHCPTNIYVYVSLGW